MPLARKMTSRGAKNFAWPVLEKPRIPTLAQRPAKDRRLNFCSRLDAMRKVAIEFPPLSGKRLTAPASVTPGSVPRRAGSVRSAWRGPPATRDRRFDTVERDAQLRLGARHIDREPAGRAKSEILTKQRGEAPSEQSGADHEHHRDRQLSDNQGAPQAPNRCAIRARGPSFSDDMRSDLFLRQLVSADRIMAVAVVRPTANNTTGQLMRISPTCGRAAH